ncbi:unknown [Eubacterium sp. CAG:786]|nr:unknown [Eubacterium sp. CAG:786]
MGLICGQQTVSVLVGFLAGLLENVLLDLDLLFHLLIDVFSLCTRVLYHLVGALVGFPGYALCVLVSVGRYFVCLCLGFCKLLVNSFLRFLAEFLGSSLGFVDDLVSLLLCEKKRVFKSVLVVTVFAYLVSQDLQLSFKLVLVLLQL